MKSIVSSNIEADELEDEIEKRWIHFCLHLYSNYSVCTVCTMYLLLGY